MAIQFKREHENSFNLVAEYKYKKQKYLVRISCSSRGPKSPGAMTSVWRISDDPSKNNENGVIPGVRGFQGPFSEAKLKYLLNNVRWDDFVSEYEYRSIMDQCEYDYERKVWTLPGRCFSDLEPDQMMQFSSRFAAHEFVYAKLKGA